MFHKLRSFAGELANCKRTFRLLLSYGFLQVTSLRSLSVLALSNIVFLKQTLHQLSIGLTWKVSMNHQVRILYFRQFSQAINSLPKTSTQDHACRAVYLAFRSSDVRIHLISNWKEAKDWTENKTQAKLKNRMWTVLNFYFDNKMESYI